MKKGDIIQLEIEKTVFPGKAFGWVPAGDGGKRKCWVKGAVAGQVLEVRIIKKRSKRLEGQCLRVLAPSPDEVAPRCPVFGRCGGCTYQNLPYAKQLEMKNDWVLGLLDEAEVTGFEKLPVLASPEIWEYRNKMEFTFGDDAPGGALQLGLHEQGHFYTILSAEECVLVHQDFRVMVRAVTAYFREKGTAYYHKRTHTGFLRHLVIRRGAATGEILVNLVTSSQEELDGGAFVQMLQALPLEGRLAGVLQTVNDNFADIVQADHVTVLFGEPLIHDTLLGLTFEISPFSFFQTNSRGAEVLYQAVRDRVLTGWAGQTGKPVIFDLYCGTGTIAQILAPLAREVIGIELVDEAVAAAQRNAGANGLGNCTFIAGDVLTAVETLAQKPDIIVLDPPREGIHPKAIFKIIAFKPEVFVYVSCKATSLARDLPFFTTAGYRVDSVQCVDMFAHGGHVECVVLMSRVEK
jgi:23S rRNA (uracil1939-C5)-methyltransferase